MGRLDALGSIGGERAVDALLRTIYGAGRAPLRATQSVVHVAAVWEREDRSLVGARQRFSFSFQLFAHAIRIARASSRECSLAMDPPGSDRRGRGSRTS